MKDSTFEIIAMVMLFISVTALYWVFVLHPRDKALYSIMDCMDGDRSYEAYENCREAGPEGHTRACPRIPTGRAPPG